MSIGKGRLWLAAGAVLLLLVGYGLFKLYFSSTSEALRHAESFLFRRMNTAQLTEAGQYRFTYVTNRQVGTPGGGLHERFSNQRTDQVTYGFFDADIQPSLGLGMLINPTEWLQNEEIDLLDVRSVAQETFVTGLREAIDQSPHGALLIVLHGYREAFESALRKTAFLAHVLDIDAPLMLFDWPGDQGTSLRAYHRAHRVATESAAELATTMRIVVDQVRPRQVWILANSMGAQVVVKALNALYQAAELADPETEIQHVVHRLCLVQRSGAARQPPDKPRGTARRKYTEPRHAGRGNPNCRTH
jgi:esterase/lipase superfamily enzyme